MATTHRSDLIDELEKALRDEVYDGGMGALSPEQLTDYVRGLAVTAAKVVGEAHTPTDDEREGMRRIIAQGSYSRGPEDLPDADADVAGRLAAAGFGFRRSEGVQANRATAGTSPNCRSIEEPQGEPSDAQEQLAEALYLLDPMKDDVNPLGDGRRAVRDGRSGMA